MTEQTEKRPTIKVRGRAPWSHAPLSDPSCAEPPRPGHPDVWKRCEAVYPAAQCPCGAFLLVWKDA